MNRRFLIRLIESIDNFKLQDALKLSDEIHKAELEGYEFSSREDKYWLELTAIITKHLKENMR